MRLQFNDFFMKRNLSILLALAIFLTACSSTVSEKSVQINELNGSGQSGTTVFSEVDGKTVVKVTLTPGLKDISQPIHLHEGSCSQVGGVRHSLSDIMNGTSETALSVDFETFKSQLPLAVNIHKSFNEPETSVACGDVSP